MAEMAVDLVRRECWYAIKTKLHCEVRASCNLEACGICAFLPMMHCKRRSGVPSVPAFPGYTFARFDTSRMLRKVNLTQGVAYVVSFSGAPAVIPDEIIHQLKRELDRKPKESRAFQKGQVVTIASGPFTGLEAVFDHTLSGGDRVALLLRSLSLQGKIKVPADFLQRKE